MPLYEYECSSCRRRFEVLQKFSDEPRKVCIHCGGPVTRLISSSSFQLKGTGWYVTDYARKSGPDAAASGARKAKDEEKPSSASSEATKETKSGTEPPSTPLSPSKTD